MEAIVNVPVHTDTLLKLIDELRRRGGSLDLSAAIGTAIDAWLAAPVAPDGARGYQWKSLFLPDGTVLRSALHGETKVARVEGDHIVHAGCTVSPNQFAQSLAHSTRNAWHDIWVRRPGDKHFRPACRLRRDVEAEQASGGGANPPRPAALPDPDAASSVRDCAPSPGWTLPERRAMRYRLEDVAFT